MPRPDDPTADLATLPVEPGAGATTLAEGDRVGRYVVGRRLGAGGMGVVYEAQDVALRRRVALKLLRADAVPARAERLLREARAAAGLSHPNVVAVYEVGVHETGPYIAMERVDGASVREWLAERPRRWREILDVFVQAGRGIAAAHAAGIVHRDVKPDNILVGRDRVRVADFGVARTVGEAVAGDPAPPEEGRLTHTGAVLGTPRYMAPEQRAGVAVDAKSDQFSFCVSLHEAFFGDVPGAGPPARSAEVPPWVQRPLARGLSADPAARYPDMPALLEDITRDPAARRRRMLLVGGGVTVVAAAVVLTWGLARTSRPCTGADANLAGVWDGPRREALRVAFLASGRGNAGATFERVAGRLDKYSADWVAARTDACEATHVRGDQSAHLLDLRMRCLDRQLQRVRALVRILEKGKGDIIDSAVDAVADSTHELCGDVESLEAALPLPDDPRARSQIGALEDKLAAVEALVKSARYEEAGKRLDKLLPKARELDYAPVLATALWAQGFVQQHGNQEEAAVDTFKQLARVAAAARNDRQVAEAWSLLIGLVGGHLHRYDEALALVPAADAAVARVGNADPAARVRLAGDMAAIYFWKGRPAEARMLMAMAVGLAEASLPPDSPELGKALNNRAMVQTQLGAFGDAERDLGRVLAIMTKVYGPAHPLVGGVYQNLGAIRFQQRRWDESARYNTQALDVFRQAFSGDHPWIVRQLKTLGLVAASVQDYDAADRWFAEAKAMVERLYPAGHVQYGWLLGDLGSLDLERGRNEDALRRCNEAFAMLEDRDPEQAEDASYCAAQALLELGRYAEAVAPLEAHVERALQIEDLPDATARARYALARALWGSRRDRRRALALARQALPEAPPEDRAAMEKDIQRWSAELRQRAP